MKTNPLGVHSTPAPLRLYMDLDKLKTSIAFNFNVSKQGIRNVWPAVAFSDWQDDKIGAAMKEFIICQEENTQEAIQYIGHLMESCLYLMTHKMLDDRVSEIVDQQREMELGYDGKLPVAYDDLSEERNIIRFIKTKKQETENARD